MEKPSQPAETLSERVRRALDDLAIIRESLMSAPLIPADGANPEPGPTLDLELAAELKIVVDTLRELLWSYISAFSAKTGQQAHEVLEWYKMELAIGALQKQAGPEHSEASSAFEDLVAKALAVTALHAGQERRV